MTEGKYKIDIVNSGNKKDAIVTYYGEDEIIQYSFYTDEIVSSCEINRQGDRKNEYSN